MTTLCSQTLSSRNACVSTRIGPADLMGMIWDVMTATVRLVSLGIKEPIQPLSVAYQLAYFEHSKAVEEIINGSKLENLEERPYAWL